MNAGRVPRFSEKAASIVIDVQIQSERRGERNWEFLARVARSRAGVEAGTPGGGVARSEQREEGDGCGPRAGPAAGLHVLALDWADYEYWCAGKVSPSEVARAVLIVLDRANPGYELPERFDCSLARRVVAGFDEKLKAELGDLDGQLPNP